MFYSNFILISYNRVSGYIIFFMLCFVNTVCALLSELSLKNRFDPITCSVLKIPMAFHCPQDKVHALDLCLQSLLQAALSPFCFVLFFKKPSRSHGTSAPCIHRWLYLFEDCLLLLTCRFFFFFFYHFHWLKYPLKNKLRSLQTVQWYISWEHNSIIAELTALKNKS